MASPAALRRVALEAAEDAAADGAVLAEFRIAPLLFESHGLSGDAAVEALLQGLADSPALPLNRRSGLIVCAMRHLPPSETLRAAQLALRYQRQGVPLLVLAGREYGSGSSRDWAAKGPALLGVRAALAESYERIHRSNLVGMGVLPLQYKPGDTASSLGLDGRETYSVLGLDAGLSPRMPVTVVAERDDGRSTRFEAIARLDGPIEVEYYRGGGILPAVLRRLKSEG